MCAVGTWRSTIAAGNCAASTVNHGGNHCQPYSIYLLEIMDWNQLYIGMEYLYIYIYLYYWKLIRTYHNNKPLANLSMKNS